MQIRSLLGLFLIFLTAYADADNLPPEILQQADAPVLRSGGTVLSADLTPLFRDPDAVANLVRLSIRLGSVVKTVDIELFDQTQPITAANFLNYIHSGRTENNIFHRSIPGFVVQGGGFRWTTTGVNPVPTFAAILNEPGRSNLRGTIAMAKLGGDPNSATSQWFVNLADNSLNLDAQNGGFTVFAQVVGAGMTVIDEVAALPRVNAGGAFTDLPVKDFSGSTINRVHTVETGLAHELIYSVTSDDAALVGVAIMGRSLGLFPSGSRSGSTTVHLTATDFSGAAITMDIPVTVQTRSQGWHFETGASGAVTLVFNPADTGTILNGEIPAAFGNGVITESKSRAFSIRNDSGAALTGITVASSGTNAPDFVVTSGATPGDIPAGGSVTFTVAMTPSAIGQRVATLRIGSADPNQAVINLLASGNGVERSQGWHFETGAGDAVTLVFNPDDPGTVLNGEIPADFGDGVITEPKSRTFSIRNDSGAALTGLSVSSSGTNAPDFVVTSGATPGDIPAGGSVTFTVAMTPSAIGQRVATLRIGSADPNQAVINLLASGIGVDYPAPTITGVVAQTLAAGGEATAVMPDLRGTIVTATDPRGISTFTQSPAPGTVLALGVYPLVFSATNSKNKTTSEQSTVRVRFDTPTTVVNVAAARSGANAPAGTTGVLTQFGTPAISDKRELAARVTVTAGKTKQSAIYVENGAGTGRIVAIQGGASGVANGAFKSFYDPLISASGKVAFGAKLSGVKSGEDEGVWTDLFGALAPILREGQTVPGMSAKLKSVLSVSITDNALIALVKLAPQAGFVTSVNDAALVRITGTSSGTVLARTGATLFGSSVKKLTVFQPSSASAGQGRWHDATGTLAKLALADKRVAFVKIANDGQQTLLLQTNTAGSGIPARLADIAIPAVGGPGITVSVIKAVQPGVSKANDTALLHSSDGTTFTELLGEGAALGAFATFSDPVINSAGDILFFGSQRASVARAAATNALWLSDGVNTPELVAALGAAAADGTNLADTTWSKFTTFVLPDGIGPVFIAQVKGRAVNGGNKLGLWAADSAGTVRQLLRAGDSIPLPTGAKTLKSFTLLNALPGTLGARRSYSGNGSLAVQATFSDRTQALLRIDVP